MSRALVTLLGVSGWATGVWVTVRLRGARRTTAPVGSSAQVAPSARLATVAGRTAGGVAAAVVAGAAVLGLGGRLMMRILAATSPGSAQGRLTDAAEEVGEVTLDGTLSLVLFVGVFGGLIGLSLFALLRRWLPDASLPAGLVTGGIGAGVVARPSGLLDPSNEDFAILEPTWLAVGLAFGLIVTFALFAAVLIDRWSASWPRPARSVRGVAGMLPLGVLLLVPPVAAVTAIAIAFAALVGPWLCARRWADAADRVLRVAVVAAAVVGTAWCAAAAMAITAA